MTTRRQFLVAGALGALSVRYVAAQARHAKVGMLVPVPLARSVYAPGVVRGLAELGYREGERMLLEYRSADGFADRYANLARELIDAKCDIIFAFGAEQPTRALQVAGSSIPIVFLAVDYDPLRKGVIANLRKPDRNTTGIYIPQDALVTKRVEFLREVLPQARRFLVFADEYSRDQIDAARKAAERARVEVTVFEFPKPPHDYAAAFEIGRQAQVEALLVLASPLLSSERAKISALLAKYRLPAVGSSLVQVESGFLMSFATNGKGDAPVGGNRRSNTERHKDCRYSGRAGRRVRACDKRENCANTWPENP